MAEELLGLGGGGWIGYLVMVVAGGVVAFRHLKRNDTLSSVNTKASVNAIERLYELLDAERRDKADLQIMLKEANERVDIANKERNELVHAMGDIKAQLAATNVQLESLQIEVRMLREGRENEK